MGVARSVIAALSAITSGRGFEWRCNFSSQRVRHAMGHCSMPQPQQTHFQLLDVPFWASSSEIRAAYKRLVLIWHPDRNTNQPRQVAQSKFQAIQQAYAVLSNPERRQLYHLECLDCWDMKEYLSQFTELLLTPSGLGLPPYSGERMLEAIKNPVPLLSAA